MVSMTGATETVAQRTITKWADFSAAWAGVHNFLLAGECAPFAFAFPPIERVVDELRREPGTSIRSGRKDKQLIIDDVRTQFQQMPMEETLRQPFAMAHFRLSVFDAPGRILHGFKEAVLHPWQKALTGQGFTFERCYPIIFLGGPGYATNFHMDFSHVLAWQVVGRKRFCGLREPDRWAPREERVTYRPQAFPMPEQLQPADALCYEMNPGDMLWNAFLTPHWVEATDSAAMSINLSHGGLRWRGQLCPHEQELEDFRQRHPEIAPRKGEGHY
jgi:hypothetical protein